MGTTTEASMFEWDLEHDDSHLVQGDASIPPNVLAQQRLLLLHPVLIDPFTLNNKKKKPETKNRNYLLLSSTNWR